MLDINILLALNIDELADIRIICAAKDVPLWTVAHRQDELCTNQKRRCISENDENVQSDAVSEWIEFLICQRSCDEVEGKVEVGLKAISQGSNQWSCTLTREKYVKSKLTN